MKKLIPFICLLFLCSCSVKLVTPTQADVNRVSAKYPGYTLSELTTGKSIYEQKCSQCHSLKDPASQTEDKWKEIVPDMAKKAAANPEATKLTDQDQDRILKYLVTMSGVTRNK